MPIQSPGPALDDVRKALEAVDAGDFDNSAILTTPRTIEPPIEAVKFPSLGAPRWHIDLARDDLRLMSFPRDGEVSSLFAELALQTDRLICGALLGPEVAQPFDASPVCGSYLTAMVHAEVANKQMQADWQRFAGNYGMPYLFVLTKPARPKWGQPGRGRRRKARFAARRLERNGRELVREVRSMMADRDVLCPVQERGEP